MDNLLAESGEAILVLLKVERFSLSSERYGRFDNEKDVDDRVEFLKSDLERIKFHVEENDIEKTLPSVESTCARAHCWEIQRFDDPGHHGLFEQSGKRPGCVAIVDRLFPDIQQVKEGEEADEYQDPYKEP